VPAGGEPVVATLTNPDTSVEYPVALTDNNDGTYTARYELPVDEPAGTYALIVRNGDVDLFRGDVTVYEAGTGVLSLDQTIVDGQAKESAVVGQPAVVLVLLRDTDNGTFSAPGVPVAGQLRGPGIAGYNQLAVEEQGQGAYALTYIAPTAGLFYLSISVGNAELPLSPYEVLATDTPLQPQTGVNPLMAPIFDAPTAPMSPMQSWSASLQPAEPLINAYVNEQVCFSCHVVC
jgi:hypothetical protein